MKTFIVILAFWLFGVSACVSAQPQQSEHFRITKSVLDAGGGTGSAASFRLMSAFGQPSPPGTQSSANFSLSDGFLSSAFSVSPLSPVQALVIRQSIPDVVLSWPHITGAANYAIYRSENPLFTPAPSSLLGTTADTTYVDADVAGLAALRNYYIVTASSGSGALLSGERRGSDFPLRKSSGGAVGRKASQASNEDRAKR